MDRSLRESPSLVKGVGLRTLSLRSSWVRIPPPAPVSFYESLIVTKTSTYKVMGKTVVGITIVGKDREGIVAAFTNFAFSKGGNIEKVNQNVIKRIFGMYLEVSFSKKLDIKKFDIEIQKLSKKEKMDVNTHHETNLEKNMAVFVTKEPLCIQTFIANKKSLKGKISVIIGTEKSLEIIAKKAKIPFIIVDEKNQVKAEEQIIQICKKYSIDLIVLARYMRILSPNFVWRYPNRIINIHPSLLPAFPGASAYAQAYERGAKIVGVTSHYVTENLDQGPIIFQDAFKVNPNDTLEKIKTKGQKLEADTLLKATKMHLENKLEVRWRKVHIKSE
jgi:formyltetrahydrofolate deformylase